MCGEKRSGIDNATVSLRDHPRMCGEKADNGFLRDFHSGSPPHVRGKVKAGTKFELWGGITPACAGKSGSLRVIGASIWDHPRMCGEKATFLSLRYLRMGSPPHVRGKGQTIAAGDVVDGITPACAGKSHRH